MLPLIWNKKIKAPPSPSPNYHNELLGLRIVTKHIIPNPNSNVVIKPILLLPQIPNSTNPNNLCFLKSCHLCHKSLPLDKEIYMYRGDLGFCSVACRERQIYLDEMKEIEISTQRILKSFRERQRRDGGGRCETGSLVEEFRQRRRGVPSEKNRVVFL